MRKSVWAVDKKQDTIYSSKFCGTMNFVINLEIIIDEM